MAFKGGFPLIRISVFGLGKLGAVIAGCYASRGFHVIGVDVNEQYVEECNRGVPPVQEPGIDELYGSCGNRLTATTDGVAALKQSDATLIVVPTPSEPDGGYSLRYVFEACSAIGEALRNKNGYHLVVLKSTVLPGSCNDQILPALEEQSGKLCGVDFGFCYNPEFIALGSVIYNLFNPDLALIGESDKSAGDRLIDMHSRFLAVKRPIARMNLVNAELAKLAVNTYVTLKITYANLLARLCERLPGGDVDVVTAALGLDSRIGAKYLKGGLGYGGPCFPRDNEALLCLARQLGVPFPLAEVTDQVNRNIPAQVAELLASKASAGSHVAILGLSYKPNTSVVDESQGIFISRILVERGFEVTVYDPLAMNSARLVLGGRVKYAESAQACITKADVVLIATPWNEFKEIDFSSQPISKRPIVVDCWGILDGTKQRLTSVLRLGVHAADTWDKRKR